MWPVEQRMRLGIVLVGLVQGLTLLLAHKLIQHGVWPATTIEWRFAWFTAAIAVPPALQLMWSGGGYPRSAGFGLALAVVLALLGIYAGRSTGSLEHNADAVFVPYVLSLALGWYVLLPFAQIWQKSGRLSFPYTELFEHAWNNVLVLCIAAVFAGIFNALLALWGGLFGVIGINFFSRLFSSEYFSYPVTAAVFGLAVSLARERVRAVVATRNIILTICSGLLPLLALIAILFLAMLPFSGLQPLWATKHATSLMLSLQILTILFLNAVYQDGTGEAPYAPWLRVAIRTTIVLLPVYSALCGYALWLRIDQHGWSVDRVWAVILAAVVGLYVTGYAVAALRRAGAWLAWVAPINVGLAAVLILLALLVNTPLLDARTISVHSQVGRLLSGRVSAEQFDYRYFRFQLGRAGEQALEQLKNIQDHAQSEIIRKQAGAALASSGLDPWSARPEPMQGVEQLAAHLVRLPGGHGFERDFLQHLYDVRDDYPMRRCFVRDQTCLVLAVDLNRDRRDEYVVFIANPTGVVDAMPVFTRTARGWDKAGSLSVSERDGERLAPLEQAIRNGNYQALEPAWRDLRIGTRRHPLLLNE